MARGLTTDQEKLLRALWTSVETKGEWPAQRQLQFDLEDQGVDFEKALRETRGVHTGSDGEVVRIEMDVRGALELPEGRALLAPLPSLVKLGIERFEKDPPYRFEPTSGGVVTWEELVTIFGSDRQASLVGRLWRWYKLAPFELVRATDAYRGFSMRPDIDILRYEGAATLDKVLDFRGTGAEPAPIARPDAKHVQLLGEVFKEACAGRAWPLAMGVALRNKALGFVPWMLERLHPHYLVNSFDTCRDSRVELRIRVLEVLPNSAPTMALVATASQKLAAAVRKASGPGQVSVSLQDLAQLLGVTEDEAVPVMLLLEREPWANVSRRDQATTSDWRLHIRDSASNFRTVGNWADYLAKRLELDPDYSLPPERSDVRWVMESYGMVGFDRSWGYPALLARFEALRSNQQLRPQERGLKLEELLYDLFTESGLAAAKAFNLPNEQIDGAFELDGATYLLEAKWEKGPIGAQVLSAFEGKVEQKSKHTRGAFLSVSGFASGAPKWLVNRRTTSTLLNHWRRPEWDPLGGGLEIHLRL